MNPDPEHRTLLDGQIEYYRARAAEYDEWFLRTGRYDRGGEANAAWFSEVEQLLGALDRFAPRGPLLEIACGTGLWTRELLRHTRDITALDSSPESLSINASRPGHEAVRYVCADLFDWTPERRYETIFFSFWLSHVPPPLFASFWEKVHSWLEPGGRVFMIDSLFTELSTASNHVLHGAEHTVIERKLNDGRTFQIVKVFYTPATITSALESLGWKTEAGATGRFFWYASAT